MSKIRECTWCGKQFEISRSNVRMCSVECRFWSKVDKSGPVPEHKPELGQCWVWTGSKNKHAYGNFSHQGFGAKRAHRVSWGISVGVLPNTGTPGPKTTISDPNVLHKCDNPSCVNPDHLFLGTQKDNNIDRVTKGRHKNGRKKLICGTLLESIIKARLSGSTLMELEKQFGISFAVIGRAVRHTGVDCRPRENRRRHNREK